jgi:hypothetical protein
MTDTEATPARARKQVLIVGSVAGVLADGVAAALPDFDVVTASEPGDASALLAGRPPTALVTEPTVSPLEGVALIAHATTHLPTMPIVFLADATPLEAGDLDAATGTLRVLVRTAGHHEVAAAIAQLCDRADHGRAGGVPLAGVLLVIAVERLDCVLSVSSGRRRGRLYLRSGQLVNAFSEDFGADGEAAAYDILGWGEPAIAVRALADDVRTLITTPLRLMLREVAAVQDQLRERTERSIPPAPPLAGEPPPPEPSDRTSRCHPGSRTHPETLRWRARKAPAWARGRWHRARRPPRSPWSTRRMPRAHAKRSAQERHLRRSSRTP